LLSGRESEDVYPVQSALHDLLSRVRAGDSAGGSKHVTAEFFQATYPLLFADGAPFVDGSIVGESATADGPKVEICGYFLWPSSMLQSTVVFFGAVNSSGKAVIYDCKIWPSEKY
jgi:hypothetical protein